MSLKKYQTAAEKAQKKYLKSVVKKPLNKYQEAVEKV